MGHQIQILVFGLGFKNLNNLDINLVMDNRFFCTPLIGATTYHFEENDMQKRSIELLYHHEVCMNYDEE